MNAHKRSYYLPLLVFFLATSIAFFLLRASLAANGFDAMVLWVMNLYLFLLSVISLYLHIRGFFHPRTQVFLRSVYGTMMMKMFLTVFAVLIYALLAGDKLNTPAVFSGMGLYFAYTFLELRVVFALLKQQKNS